ncbi:hypothetical protein [Microtetraspora malaysiensis]|uniref:DUF805 domain-containing protein n=1 Tax=Microtetraspora malaysiensis TaxID=161358 RepID=A0ABW6SME8_9ACTN
MHVDAGGDRGKEPDDWKSGIGDLVADLLSYWTFGAGDYTGSSRPYGPVRLIVWTALSIGVAASVSAVRIALFGEPRAGWAIALVPLIMPMVGALAHRPRRWQGGLALGAATGVLTAVGLGIDMSSSVNGFWSGFIAISAGFLVCSAMFAAITWPRR